MKPSISLCSFLLAAGSSLLVVSSASAQTWDGGGADTNWNTGLNWSTDVAPVSGASITFAGTVRPTNANNIAANTTFNAINFTNSTAGQAFSISGNAITLGGNITTTASSGAGITDTVGLAMILNGNREVTTNTLHNLTLSGLISQTGGTRTLTKSGAGTLTLTADNTYTGNTTVSAGTLKITSGGSLYGNAYNGTAVVTVQSGAVLELDNWNYQSNEGLGQLAKEAARIVINGGTIRMNANSEYGRGVTVQSGGATFEAAAGADWKHSGFDLTANTYTSNPSLTFTGAGNGTFGKAFSGSGSLTKSGAGTWTLSVVNSYTGGTNVNAGSLTLGHATDTLANTGAVNVNGGTLALGTNTDTVGAVTLTSGSITGSGAGRLTGTSYAVESGTVSAKLGGSGALTKSTSGTVTISSDNSGVGGYTGAVAANAGTLIVNGNISTSLVTVASAGTLAGTGTVGSTTVNGTIAPGNSIGTLNVSGTLSLTNIASFEIDPTLGSGFNRASDLASASGAVTYGGTLNVLYGGLASDFTNGMIFNLFDGSSFSGSFTTLNLPSLTGGLTWQDNLLSNGTLTVVPEPASALLGAIGMVLLLRRRRA